MQPKFRVWTKCLLVGAVLCVVLFSVMVRPQAMPTEQPESKGFYFAQISDTHFGVADSEQRTQQVIQAINNLPMKIEFVVHTGDITSERIEDASTVDNALAAFKLLKAPIHFIPGNHDILRQRQDTTIQIFKKRFGDLITQKEYGGVVCLFVYTEPLASEFSVPSYDALKELEKRLKQSAGKPAIVFHHSPSVEDFYQNQMHPGWRTDIQERWIALLNKYSVKGVLAGHFHRDEHHWLGNVPLYVCPPVAGAWGRQAAFRIYEYKGGKISYRTQYIPS